MVELMANKGGTRAAGISVILAYALLTWASSRAQSQGSTALRVTTRVVSVNAVVTDAHGDPVKDLTQDDFILVDGGQPQKVMFFSAVDNTRHSSSASLGPDTFTNRPLDYGALPSTTILLFDTLNSRWTSQGYGLHRIRQFLRQIEPQDHLGIYVLGDDLKVVHEFNRDASDLVEAMHRYEEVQTHVSVKSPSKQESTGDAALDRLLAGKDNRYRFELDSRVARGPYRLDKLAFANQMTTASVELIARELASFEGRKTLIWVTDSIGTMGQFESDDLQEFLKSTGAGHGPGVPRLPVWENGLDIERMIRLMNGAGIAVYTVDARGLEAEDLDFRNTASPASEPVGDLIARTPEPNGDLLELAKRTGGRAFFNRNDLETGIRRAEDDARLTYNLAYAPDHGRWKGEWRNVQLKVNRPGVTVLARGGYFALPDPRPVPKKNLFEFFGQIAASPIDSTQLPLSVHIGVSPGAQGRQIEAQVHLDLAPMLTLQSNGHWTGNFEVMFMQIGSKNKLLDATRKDVSADLDSAEYANRSQKGWDLPVSLKFMPGAMQLCVILHDKSSDAAGSVHIPLAKYVTPTVVH